MWSSTKTWSRSTDRRSSSSGRSWWAMVDDRRLQLGHVRLEGDGDLVPEAALQARRHGAQEPGGHRRDGQADGGEPHAVGVALDHAVAEQGEPQREERVGQRGEQRGHEREAHEHRLVLVAELAHAPHRRDGRREVVVAGQRSGEDIEGPPPPRPRRRRSARPGGRTSCGSDRRAASARRGCRAPRPGRARARRSGRRGARWRTGATRGSSCSAGWRPAPARRSPPRRARRAGRSARRAARRRRRAAPRTAPGRGRPAATGRRRGRCRPGSPWRAGCRGRRARRRRPPRGRRAPRRRRRRPARRCRAAAARSG